ncbi:MAG: hypothetical protein ACREXS_01895 [Gammaproteobacteria bacterium]
MTDRLDPSTPSNQILRYLSAAEVASDRVIRWGILTNGSVWRLYYQGARSRSDEFFEIDLEYLLGVPGVQNDLFSDLDREHGLKLFYCLFHRAAFHPQPWDNDQRTFHQVALAEARLYEEKVSKTRRDALFFQLYGISRDDAAYILDTFPIVREHDEHNFGKYLTKELVLGYMNALAADTKTVLAV